MSREKPTNKLEVRISAEMVKRSGRTLTDLAGSWSEMLPIGRKFIAEELEGGEIILKPTSWIGYVIWTFGMSLKK